MNHFAFLVPNHVRLNFSCRGLPWLWSGSHTSRLLQLIRDVLVVRVVEATDVLVIVCWILWSDKLIPGRLKGSHPMIFTNLSVSLIVVSGFYSGPFPCTDLLDCFVPHFVGSFWWLLRHRQVLTSSFCPVLGSKLKPCLCGPKHIVHNQSSQ